MVYKNNFVAALRVNGKILREDTNGIVHLPFGSEYQIRLKNLNSVRAIAKVTIDGKDATGAGIILPANGTVDLERFIQSNNLDKGNAFKFAELTPEVEEARGGLTADEGLIRISFTGEHVAQKQTVITEHIHHHHNDWYPNWSYRPPLLGGNYYGGVRGEPNAFGGQLTNSNTANVMQEANFERIASKSILRSTGMNVQISANINQVSADIDSLGITVPGSINDQKFSVGPYFPLESVSHVITLQLRGKAGEKQVEQPITVKTKLRCSTCRFVSKSSNKFCPRCGTSLILA